MDGLVDQMSFTCILYSAKWSRCSLIVLCPQCQVKRRTQYSTNRLGANQLGLPQAEPLRLPRCIPCEDRFVRGAFRFPPPRPPLLRLLPPLFFRRRFVLWCCRLACPKVSTSLRRSWSLERLSLEPVALEEMVSKNEEALLYPPTFAATAPGLSEPLMRLNC